MPDIQVAVAVDVGDGEREQFIAGADTERPVELAVIARIDFGLAEIERAAFVPEAGVQGQRRRWNADRTAETDVVIVFRRILLVWNIVKLKVVERGPNSWPALA
nr:hypothetical protein [Hankyongella ginsenosidimutans]